MTSQQITGAEGEEIASQHLVNKGFKILERNLKWGPSEIDIIAGKGNEIVFVEVKTQKVNALIDSHLKINKQKQKAMIRAAQYFMQKKHPEKEAHFDAVLITVQQGKGHRIEHIEYAFAPGLR